MSKQIDTNIKKSSLSSASSQQQQQNKQAVQAAVETPKPKPLPPFTIPQGMYSSSGSSINIVFYNKCQFKVNVYWLNYEGTETRYASLNPEDSYTQQTYVTHAWIVRAQLNYDVIYTIWNSDSSKRSKIRDKDIVTIFQAYSMLHNNFRVEIGETCLHIPMPLDKYNREYILYQRVPFVSKCHLRVLAPLEVEAETVIEKLKAEVEHQIKQIQLNKQTVANAQKKQSISAVPAPVPVPILEPSAAAAAACKPFSYTIEIPKSTQSNQKINNDATLCTFVNETTRKLHIAWVDFKGYEQLDRLIVEPMSHMSLYANYGNVYSCRIEDIVCNSASSSVDRIIQRFIHYYRVGNEGCTVIPFKAQYFTLFNSAVETTLHQQQKHYNHQDKDNLSQQQQTQQQKQRVIVQQLNVPVQHKSTWPSDIVLECKK